MEYIRTVETTGMIKLLGVFIVHFVNIYVNLCIEVTCPPGPATAIAPVPGHFRHSAVKVFQNECTGREQLSIYPEAC
jgi:hypothetical protein